MKITRLFSLVALATPLFSAASPSSIPSSLGSVENSTLNARGNGLGCVPTDNQGLCVLTYSTNSGGVINPQAPQPPYARVEVYGPECQDWGGNQITLEGKWPILAAGLDLNNPLMFGTEVTPGLAFRTPSFSYDGEDYVYNDCWCWTQDLSLGLTGCECIFKCTPYPL